MKKTDRPENVFCSIFDPETNGNTVARIRWLRSFYLSRLSWFSRFIIVIIVRIMRRTSGMYEDEFCVFFFSNASMRVE